MSADQHPLLLPVTVALAGVALLATIFVVGVRDAEEQARERLIADTAEPQTFELTAGRFSDAGADEEFAAYYPDRLLAHAGDTLRFTNPTAEDPHSVTFGLRADRSDQPRFGTGAAALTVTEGACVSDVPLTPTTTHCAGPDDAERLPAFAGQTYYNSGIIPPGGGRFDLRLDPVLDAGRYVFGCVIHPGQTGVLEVVPAGEPTQRPDDVQEAADDLAAEDRDVMADLQRRPPTPTGAPTGATVQAGVATDRVSLNRFFSAEVRIDVGETVTWANAGSVPHVVVFGGAAGPEVIAEPPTVPDGTALPDGLVSSGPIGPLPYPVERYRLRFAEAGRFSYVCPLHPGMAGTVVVEDRPADGSAGDGGVSRRSGPR